MISDFELFKMHIQELIERNLNRELTFDETFDLKKQINEFFKIETDKEKTLIIKVKETKTAFEVFEWNKLFRIKKRKYN